MSKKQKKNEKIALSENKTQENISSSKNINAKPITLENIYGKSRISESVNYTKKIFIPNPKQVIPYGIKMNNQTKNKDSKKFIPNHILKENSRTIYSNLDETKIEDAVIDLVNKAKKMICISTFLLEAKMKLIDLLFDLSKKGIRIYFIIASKREAEKARKDEGEDAVNSHLEFLEKAGSGFMHIRSGGFHAKYIIVDPNTENSQGFFLTANIAKRPLTRNNEIAIRLDGPQTNDLFRQFKFGFWIESNHQFIFDEISQKSILEPLSSKEGQLEESNQKVIWTTSDSKTIKKSLLDYIKNNNPEEFWISSWNFSLDNEISNNIMERANHKCRILLTNREKNYEAILGFLDKGCEIKFNFLQHAKFFITDDFAAIFSANFENQGMEQGYESGVILEDITLIKELKRIFQFWFENAEEIGKKDVEMKDIINMKIKIFEKSEKPITANEIIIKENHEIKPNFHFNLPLSKYMEYIDLTALKSYVLSKENINLYPFAINTSLNVTLSPEGVNSNLKYVKEKNGFHIWVAGNKKVDKKYLVINFDPLENSSKIKKAQGIAEKENAEIILY